MRSDWGARWRRAIGAHAVDYLSIGRQAYAWWSGAAGAEVPVAQGEFTAGDAAAAAAVLTSLLDERRAPAVALHLAPAWCRLWMLPWNVQLTGAERWQNFARARFEERYGESADDWCVTVAGDLPGRDRLAAAWPAPMRAALLGRRELRSVRPQVLVALQACLRQQSSFTGCLAEIDGGSAFFLLLASGSVRRTRGCRTEALPAALGAEWAALSAADDRDANSRDADGARRVAITAPFSPADGPIAQALALECAALGFDADALPSLAARDRAAPPGP